ncbi:TetR/AcrR family transcriptional regulator [Kribbella catacumbae]|uniref:TetR/AcrR family transcriptional regulator n=1 Tax=Kribbella catacumbae TaxID=460086 RepID=UPI00036E0482|nr:TetR/AcrR family transcriptional regulator [Kribbella catacumbae]
MPRKNAEVRRLEVLDETLNQIRAVGMSVVRIADVAGAMGVSPALIVYHFQTKENLLAEALIHAAERDLATLGRVLRGADSPATRLMAALDWYSPTGRARGWQIWIDAWSAAMRDKTLAKVLTDLHGRWVDEIAKVVADGVETGVFTSADPRASATRITALLDGLAVRMVVHTARPTRGELRAWLLLQVCAELAVEELRLLDSVPAPN